MKIHYIKNIHLLFKSTLWEQFRVHCGGPHDFRRHGLVVCLKNESEVAWRIREVTEISHVCYFTQKYNHLLFETCNANAPAMNLWCLRKHSYSYHNRGILWKSYGKLTVRILANDKNYSKMLQVAFALLKKSFSKILTCSYRENHWSPKHRVPLLNLRNQHAEEMRMEVHCLLCLIFSESTLHPLVSKGCWKTGWVKGCDSNHWRQYFTIDIFKIMVTDHFQCLSGSLKTSLN